MWTYREGKLGGAQIWQDNTKLIAQLGEYNFTARQLVARHNSSTLLRPYPANTPQPNTEYLCRVLHEGEEHHEVCTFEPNNFQWQDSYCDTVDVIAFIEIDTTPTVLPSLEGIRQPDNSLKTLPGHGTSFDGYISWVPESTDITLDGRYTADQLEAIIQHMRLHNENV